MGEKQAAKGARNEEVLRNYFLEQGFFVARGLKLRQGDAEATDVDLWLYQRPTAVFRQRAIVDAKDRRRPEAMERVLWSIGVRAVTGVEHCIVATTDRRAEVKALAAKGDVTVLDGSVLARLASKPGPLNRLSEEDFATTAFPSGDEKLLGNWRRRIEDARSRLLNGLDADGCNAWLEDARYFLEAASEPRRTDAALRLSYLVVSYFLIGLDWTLRSTAFNEREDRKTSLEDGFRFGSRGRRQFDDLLRTSEELLVRFFPEHKGTAASMRNQASEVLASVPARALAEFFSRQDVASRLFKLALEFERAAYAQTVMSPRDMSADQKSVLGVILDFFGLPRERFLGQFNVAPVVVDHFGSSASNDPDRAETTSVDRGLDDAGTP